MNHLIKENNFSDIWNPNLSIPIPAIDIVIFTIYQNEVCVVLLKQELDGKNNYILPGGIVAKGYSLEENFDNILERKTGIRGVYKEQLYTFGNPDRDKRGHTISITYFALVGMDNFLKNVDLTKVAIVRYSDINENNVGFKDKKIGTDHFEIIKYAKQRLKWKLEYTNIAKDMLPKKFRMSQLQEIYEIVLGEKIDKRNFGKKIFKLNMIEETGELDKSTNRPAKLYRFIDSELKIYDVM
ncbi:MAG: NUDIX hydrolase [Candidatus Gracilibacteria bacterium]|nr:NUDIX hydrolase [Candidatus Gracilibacteria bacterium]